MQEYEVYYRDGYEEELIISIPGTHKDAGAALIKLMGIRKNDFESFAYSGGIILRGILYLVREKKAKQKS